MASRKTKKKTRRRPPPTSPRREGASGKVGKPGGHAIPSPRPGSSWHERVVQEPLAALVLCLLVAACYFPVTSAGFVWDDVAFTKAEPVQSLSGIWQIWFEPSSLEKREGHYWPVLYTTFWLEHKLWGFAPLGYHLVNLLLHAAVTLLLWRVLRRMAVPGAWVAAMIFAVHPLHVESVAWVIGRKDLLAALFYLGAALAYMRFVEDRRWQRYAIALALFTAGLLCKSMLVTLPATLLIWHWWKHGRVTANDVARVLPLLLVGLFVTVIDWSFYKNREVISFDYSLIERALIAARALAFYVGKLAWPAELMVIYPHWEVGVGDWFAWGCVLTAMVVAGLLWRYQRQIGRGPLAGLLFFAVTLSPTLGFVDYGFMQFSFVADRYQYLAGIGVIAVVVGAVAHGLNRLAGASVTSAASGAAVGMAEGAAPSNQLAGARRVGIQVMASVMLAASLTALGMTTWRQASLYHDSGTLFTHIIAHNPEARTAHHNLGDWLLKQKQFKEAIVAYRIAVAQRPDFAPIRHQMGRAFDKLQQYEKAGEQYRISVEINPRFVHGMHSLGAVLARQQRYQESLEHFRNALATDPNYRDSHIGMGAALAKLNRLEEAEAHYQKARQRNPRFPDALDHLGALRLKQQRYEEALEFFQTLIEVQPGRVRAYIGKGISLSRLNRHEDALRSFDRALALDPTLEEARTHRALALKTLGRSDG